MTSDVEKTRKALDGCIEKLRANNKCPPDRRAEWEAFVKGWIEDLIARQEDNLK